ERGDWLTIPRGEHGHATESHLEAELERALDAGSSVVVDLSEIEFMDSSVVHALVSGYQRAQADPEHRIALVVPLDGVARHVVSLTGIDQIPTYLSRAGALAAVSGDGRATPQTGGHKPA